LAIQEFRQSAEVSATIAEMLLEWGSMADLLNLAMLICASIASMAFGILAAYGILRVGFALMRPQSRKVGLKQQPQAARVS
jgi:hypothetical protein